MLIKPQPHSWDWELGLGLASRLPDRGKCEGRVVLKQIPERCLKKKDCRLSAA